MLNAFRHQRKGHVGRAVTGDESVKCSTPFGINGRVTEDPRLRQLTQQSAQRLSASTEGSHTGSASRKETWQCSTPFGINGRVTPVLGGSQHFRSAVLNAFRHQRKGHHHTCPVGVFHVRVLNAFRHQRKGHTFTTLPSLPPP